MASDRTGNPDTGVGVGGNRAGRKNQEGKLCRLQSNCMDGELYHDIFIHVCNILMSTITLHFGTLKM